MLLPAAPTVFNTTPNVRVANATESASANAHWLAPAL